MTIKRGTPVKWHEPAHMGWAKKMKDHHIVKDKYGDPVLYPTRIKPQCHHGKCFSVMRLPDRQPEALFLETGKRSMKRVPLSELEEVDAKYPGWYEDAIREIQRAHDGPESRSLRYQRLQLKTSWWRMMDACGFMRVVKWLSRTISKFERGKNDAEPK